MFHCELRPPKKGGLGSGSGWVHLEAALTGQNPSLPIQDLSWRTDGLFGGKLSIGYILSIIFLSGGFFDACA